MRSPSLMWRGTFTRSPVSTLASFFTFVAVLPFTAISAQTTSMTTVVGRASEIGVVSWKVTSTSSLSRT